jgi:hypothetical protein
MNWFKQIVRLGLTKAANKQRKVFLRSKGLAPVQTKAQTHLPNFSDASAHLAYPVQSIDVSNPTIREVQKQMLESHGLLDLVPKKRNFEGTSDLGDFASVNQENFAHALHFSKADIDFGTFNIDEIETVCSQTIEISGNSIRRINENEANYLEESENSSNISYTETDIFIELPNSEVIGNPVPKFENPIQSAAF